MNARYLAFLAWTLLLALRGLGQSAAPDAGNLDPTRSIPTPSLEASVPLPEQYIWTQAPPSTAAGKSAPATSADQEPPPPHYFRHRFTVAHAPAQATLYVAGPNSVKVYLNGRQVLDTNGYPSLLLAMKIHVFTADVTAALQPGQNVIAVEGMRNQHLYRVPNMGQVLVAKIVPAGPGVDAPPLEVTNSEWRGTIQGPSGWQQADFQDSAWPQVHTLGPITGNIEYLQANTDSGLYAWPGYTGVSAFLARYTLAPQKVEEVFPGSSKIENVAALTASPHAPAEQKFTVSLSAPMLNEQDAPSIVLDFGKEVAGWVEFLSDSDQAGTVTVQYGESEGEMLHEPYLGINPLEVPAHGAAHGPKSAFRFAKIRFLQASAPLRFRAIRLNGIYYPVTYRGSFASSDPLLNRIWEVGAYTAHLCMQDDIWDAPKRDRARWMGDLDVSGDVIDSVFADHFLMQDTLTRLIGAAPVAHDVNGISGYSAFWVMVMADYDRHVGDPEYLAAMQSRLLQLLAYMEGELGPDHLYRPDGRKNQWVFVDWSPYLNGDTPEARMATDLEFYRAFVQGAALLQQLGDTRNAQHFAQLSAAMKRSAERHYVNPQTGTFGTRWQTNAMAIYSGLADKTQYDAIWKKVLSTIASNDYTALIITPYYNYYVISAMAETGHRAEALDWIRKYWSGMITEGATTFWEAYDPSWPKQNFHASLQGDNSTGYFISLCHGWSSGPTAWLMEQILGIQPTAGGFREVTVRPDLAGLAWAKGTEPTPYGPIRVDLRSGSTAPISLDIPNGVHATVLIPASAENAIVEVNGKPTSGHRAEDGHRIAVRLDQGGHFEIISQTAPH